MQTPNKTIEAVIVEDEVRAIEILKLHLSNHCPTIRIVGVASNFEDGLALLQKHKPDLVFLDVELNDPAGSGIELIESYGIENISIIFFTGYDKYVEESYRLNAVHYIKKPISIVALKKAVEKVEQQITTRRQPQHNFYTLNTLKGSEFIPFKDIVWLKADGAVTHICVYNKPEKISSETLGEIEKQLPPTLFCRIHRSYIVNKNYVAAYQKEGLVILTDGSAVPISGSQVKSFLQWFMGK